jgi:hypothetical protein
MKQFLTPLQLKVGLAIAAMAACGPFLPKAHADEWNKRTIVTVSGGEIEVPGAVLEPGKYVFKLVDSQSDRHIVQILNERENHVFTTTFAIPKERLVPADKTILTYYETPAGQPLAVKAWFFPGDNIGQEFVYPKERAAELRAGIGQPAQPVATLITPAPAETTTPQVDDQPAPPAPAPAVSSDTSSQEANPPAPAPPPEDEDMTPPSGPASNDIAPPAQDSSAAQTPSDSAGMPKTAGELPLIALAGLVSLAGASAVKIARSAR